MIQGSSLTLHSLSRLPSLDVGVRRPLRRPHTYSTLDRSGHRAWHWSLMLALRLRGQSAAHRAVENLEYLADREGWPHRVRGFAPRIMA